MDVLAVVITAVFTVVSPLAIAWKKSPHWSTALKTGVPIAVSVIIAVGFLAYTGGFNDGADIFTAILTVYGVQQLVYSTILKNMAEKLEWKDEESEEDVMVVKHKDQPPFDQERYPDIGT